MLHVLLEPPSPRARYVVRHVFERMLGWQLSIAGSREEFRSATGPKLSYSSAAIEAAYHVPMSGALDRGATPMPVTVYGRRRNMTVLYPMPQDGFDVFASIFHLLSLAEEYAVQEKDEHGRVPATALSLVANHLERTPVVDQWVLRLADELRAMFPALPVPSRSYRHVLTVDVDNGLKYAARSWQRAMGASMKDIAGGHGARFFERWQVRRGITEDPYATFVDRLAEVRNGVDHMIAFVLTRGEGRFDHAARIDHPVFTRLLERLGQVAEIGLHPSYDSSARAGLFALERDLLGRATGRIPVVSRQHFLRWRMPDTFRALIESGFTEDHSIGFSDRPGFRAGTCTPFPWYDLEREEETGLMLHPFAVMDSALARGSGDRLLGSVDTMQRMSDTVREVQGRFVSVWHDRYLSGDAEYAGAPEAMRQVIEHARA